jgi:hypothetical protein
MIELTEQQREELQQSQPVHVLGPDSRTEYILVRADIHTRLQALLEQAEAAQEGWADAVEVARYEMVNNEAP